MRERELLENGLPQFVHNLPEDAVDKLLSFSALLLEKNRHMNLTAVETPEEVATRHFLDCASLTDYVGAGDRIIDVGTGAGFPGLPLAVLCPSADFILLDSQRKRVDFLNAAIDKLGLTNCTAVHSRAEDYAREHREVFDLAVSRAVAELRVLCELSMPLVRKGGEFLAMKASDCEYEVSQAANAIETLGGGSVLLLWDTVPISETRRALVRIQKERESPETYPRRFKKIISSPL